MISEPAIGNAFFGREDILHVLEKRVNALKVGCRQNIALTGQMLSGKSSILSQFIYSLKDTSLVPIYVEIVEEPFSAFADKFIATLLYSYLASTGAKAKNDLSELIAASAPLMPRTVYAIKRARGELNKKNYADAYRKLLGLTSLLKEETGKSCVVILDEFHNMESLKIKNPYLHFGKMIMIQKDTMYIVSSSQKSAIKKILSEKLALLYGNFEVIEVSGFDHKTAECFIKEKLAPIHIPEKHSDYLINFTDKNPFYLDVISKKMAEIANSGKRPSVEEDIIVEAFTALIHNTSGTINQYFTNNIMNLIEKNLRKDYLELLIALALGFNKLKELAGWFNKKNTGAFSARLTHLMALNMVYQNGVFYEVQDKVFKFWLRTVYHRKKASLVDDVIRRTEDFKKEVACDADGYKAESRKGTPERVKELFTLFNGEIVEIEKKKRKLPRFIRVEVQKYGRSNDLLTHQSDDRYWVCEICRDRIDETTIIDFIERYHADRDKIAKKICVALAGIDANALLIAKEKNIWVWGMDNINALFRLYKRHNLIYR